MWCKHHGTLRCSQGPHSGKLCCTLRDVAKKLDEEIVQEGRTSSHAAAEPSNGRQHAAEADDRAHRGGEEGSRRGDEGGARGAHDDRDRERDRDRDRGKGRRRERSESPDDRDRRRRRRRYSRSRSPDRDRCGGPPVPCPTRFVWPHETHIAKHAPVLCWEQAARSHSAARNAGALAVTSSMLPCAICL